MQLWRAIFFSQLPLRASKSHTHCLFLSLSFSHTSLFFISALLISMERWSCFGTAAPLFAWRRQRFKRSTHCLVIKNPTSHLATSTHATCIWRQGECGESGWLLFCLTVSGSFASSSSWQLSNARRLHTQD